MREIYVTVKSFINLCRTPQTIIRIKGIKPCFMMNKNLKKGYPKTLLTLGFDRNIPTVIKKPVKK